jgi:hypothetical protein
MSQPFSVQGGNGGATGFNNYNQSIGGEIATIRGDDSYQFFRDIQGLVSASMDPQELGNVMPYGDVVIMGFIDMDRNGTINTENSRLRLEIWDDYARNGSASEIALSFNRMKSYNPNGNQITMVFGDDFGDIIVSGEYTQYDFYGYVTYRNTKSFDGSSSYAEGNVGSFQVSVCGLFRCQ